ncbi:hypothetical protein ABKV19_014767 [Rosa sericea]
MRREERVNDRLSEAALLAASEAVLVWLALCVFALEKDTSSFFWYGLFARHSERKRETKKSYRVFRILIASRWDRKKKKKRRPRFWSTFRAKFGFVSEKVVARILIEFGRKLSIAVFFGKHLFTPTSTVTPKYPNR